MRILKHLLAGAAVVAGLSLATAALAVPIVGGGGAVTGSLIVTGTVTTKCAVITGGSGSTFSGTIGLGTLNGANGTILLSTLNTSTVTAAAGSQAFQVNCNGSDATIDLKASRLSTSGSAPTGYSANIDYSAALIAGPGASGSTKTFTYTTASSLAGRHHRHAWRPPR